MNSMIYPPYFIQTTAWAQFWLEASCDGHHFYELKDNESSIIVYQYPWYFKQNFLYIPKAPLFSLELQRKAIELAKKKHSAFIKIDFDDQYSDFSSILKLPRAKLSAKTLQFMQTMTLDTSRIVVAQSTNETVWKDFYTQNIPTFWHQTNQNIRRYTKKSCDQNWQISIEKTKENFEAFWEVYSQTKERQQFATQPRPYIQHLYEQPFSRIIILRDSLEKPHCVWLGLATEKTLTYLAGGNTDYSFDHYGQYLAHLVATYISGSESLPFYDLGGYNPNLGFGKFKEGYRGNIRTFQGPIDIILKPIIFKTIIGSVELAKRTKHLFSKTA